MNVKSSAMLSGAVALGLAAAVLGVSMLAGVPVLSTNVRTSNPGTPGTLSILLTDPPHVPEGVTAVYVTYSNLAVHVSEAGNDSGWTKLSSGGTINLLSTVNISKTIAAVKVHSGDYNALRLNVSSAQVTFNEKNYTAFVVNAKLFIPIVRGGIEVNDSKPSATIIDISPMVINIGSSTTPEFVIRAAAVAYPVPSSQVTGDMEHEGFTFGLGDSEWWQRINENATANLSVTGATLSSSSLSVSVKDLSKATTIKLVVVSPLARPMEGATGEDTPSMLWGTAVFVVETNGTLVPLRQYVMAVASSGSGPLDEIREGLSNIGFNLAAGSSATFSFSGTISLGFSEEGFLTRTVVSGQQYLVTVIGTDAIASQAVVAS